MAISARLFFFLKRETSSFAFILNLTVPVGADIGKILQLSAANKILTNQRRESFCNCKVSNLFFRLNFILKQLLLVCSSNRQIPLEFRTQSSPSEFWRPNAVALNQHPAVVTQKNETSSVHHKKKRMRAPYSQTWPLCRVVEIAGVAGICLAGPVRQTSRPFWN